MVYKIYFKGLDEIDIDELKLTFKEIRKDNPIIIPHEFIEQLKNLSSEKNNIINIQNIDSVHKFTSDDHKDLSNFVVILNILKNRKKGFLTGFKKKSGDVLLGIWPFQNYQEDMDHENFIDEYRHMVEEHLKYEKICIIT